ncbi:MAG: cyclic peptide export ABC transporter, partial [Thermoanaerobaculia bacterium]
MKVLYSFLRRSKSLATWAVVAALVSGVSSTAVIWVIHRAMVAERAAIGTLLQTFIGLCLVVI